ncbi:MAG: hypothetical protein TE42_08720 [Candidatus Synechococcus spongiarum SP3]|uniref:GUN4-like domain-containing protein n=1 Tax=Candidatus Synechococcus spongiarum SP3 TaxID=1604020 RepID=A0A0G2HJH5_9SYNE|nr:MAG: hypothetical protein TE42_08720 [Candidatus Synechococcus spongiarum SP3]
MTVPAELLDELRQARGRQRQRLFSAVLDQAQQLVAFIPTALQAYDPAGDDWAAGSLIQLLMAHGGPTRADFLRSTPQGWFAAPSAMGQDHQPLQRALAIEAFEEADRLTMASLRRMAGPAAVGRGYVFFSEVPALAMVDLDTIDRLWVAYSRGRYGFSVQRRLLKACGGRWEQLWSRLGWKEDGVWTRYPHQFTWRHGAPEGHMPLVNQLRGVRLMDALLNHPAIVARCPGA